MYSFVRSLHHACIRSYICILCWIFYSVLPVLHSFILSVIHSFIHSFGYSLSRFSSHSFANSFIKSFI
jgi:hypothetical protein